MNRTFEDQAVALEVEPAASEVGETYQLPFSFCTGWDPYEIWCTRVRVEQPEADPVVSAQAPAARQELSRAKRTPRWVATCVSRLISALVWPALLLALAVGLNRELVGIFGVDVIRLMFGVMTPAARAVHVLLGFATICAVVVAVKPAGGRQDGD